MLRLRFLKASSIFAADNMNIGVYILSLAFMVHAVMASAAEPECKFEDTTHRRISGDNQNDFRCIETLARAGDEYWQYYLGLILVGQVPGPNKIPEGLAVLKEVAKRDNKYSADAMRFIGSVYKRANTDMQNLEIAYQWLYLASQRPPFKGTAILLPDAAFNSAINPRRMKELERDAPLLLRSH